MKWITAGVMTLCAVTLLPGILTGATYEIDLAHSSVGFSVRHLAISKVRGEFTGFSGSFEFDPAKPGSWRATATIDAASIDTDNQDRDNHLRSEDFLFAEKYPQITFASTGVEMTSKTEGRLLGNLTIRGVTKPVVLDLEVLGTAEFMGVTKAGFTARGQINRKDFGLTWHKALETGGLVVGDTVEIVLEVEGNLKQ